MVRPGQQNPRCLSRASCLDLVVRGEGVWMSFLLTVSSCCWLVVPSVGRGGGQRKPLQWAGWELGALSREQRAGADGSGRSRRPLGRECQRGAGGLLRVSPWLWSCSLSLSHTSEEVS